MREQLLTDKEIEDILSFKKGISGVNILEFFHMMGEQIGLYEAEKDLQSFFVDKSIILTEQEKRRSKLEQRASLITGDVNYNPEGLRCPECGCKYIAQYYFVCYLRETGPKGGPERKQRLTALSSSFGEEFNYCMGCGYEFDIKKE